MPNQPETGKEILDEIYFFQFPCGFAQQFQC